jgi:anti-anti-sigma factor
MISPVVTGRTLDGSVRISPHGEIDMGNAYQVREAVDAALIGRKPGKIVIDLADVTLIDSVGIGVLVSCYHAAAACRVPLAATHACCTVYRQLWVAGLIGLFGLATPHAEHEGAVA